MSAGPPVPVSNLATVFIQGPAYGIFLVLFSISTRRFIRRANAKGQGLRSLLLTPLFLASVGMLGTITADFVVNSIRTFLAFIYFDNGTEPLLFYANIGHWTTTATQALTFTTLTFADTILVYRVAAVYGGNKLVVAIPLATLLASVATGIAEIVNYSSYKVGENPYTFIYGAFTTAPTMTTLCNNIICSSLIFFRVWRAQAKVSMHLSSTHTSALQRVGINLIQSAGLYVAWGLAFQIAVLARNSFLQPLWDSWAAVTGIAFMLINLQTLKSVKENREPASIERSYPSAQRRNNSAFGQDLIVLPQWAAQSDSGASQISTASAGMTTKRDIALELGV